jgi:hypothetical protein
MPMQDKVVFSFWMHRSSWAWRNETVGNRLWVNPASPLATTCNTTCWHYGQTPHIISSLLLSASTAVSVVGLECGATKASSASHISSA